MRSRIRTILKSQAGLRVDVAELDDEADLFAAGMTSHRSVQVMFSLEEEFGVAFPDAMLRPAVFTSVHTMADAVAELQAA